MARSIVDGRAPQFQKASANIRQNAKEWMRADSRRPQYF
jgi:hypothetical protein